MTTEIRFQYGVSVANQKLLRIWKKYEAICEKYRKISRINEYYN